MFCKYCGAPLPENGKFCPGCGHAIETAEPAEEYRPVEDTPAEPQEETADPYADPYGDPIGYTEIKDPWATPTEETPIEEPTYTEEPAADPQQYEVPEHNGFIPPQEPPVNNDPFRGPAHPSVKKNIIITCVALGIATVLSMILMVVGIVKLAQAEASLQTPSTWEEMEQEYNSAMNGDGVDFGTETLYLGEYGASAGNTANNTVNGGTSVNDGNGGAYYIDYNEICHRSADDDIESILSNDEAFYSNLNRSGNTLYYTKTNFDDIITVCSYDLNSEKETELWDSDENVYFISLWKDTLYITRDYDIHSLDLSTSETTTIFESDQEIFDPYVCDKGIYYVIPDEDFYGTLYRIDHEGNHKEEIALGYYFRFDGDTIYINDLNDSGYDTVETTDLDGNDREIIYSFDEYDTYIDGMHVEDDILYCSTVTNGTYRVEIIDLITGDARTVEENSTETESPYYGISLAGNWLFYYDSSFDYGIRVCDLTEY